jgi:protein phosphatase
LLKALTGHEVEPSLTVREARAGDRYLLCSDGLSDVVSAETIAEGLSMPDPESCIDRLIELALRGGGPDNITCIVADVVDVDYGEDAPIIAGAAGDGVEQPQPDSAASRAATTTLPRPAPVQPQRVEPAPPDPQLLQRKRKRTLIGLGVLATLVAVVVAIGSILVLGQYYVAAGDNGEVAVFQGVRGDFLGLPLHSWAEGSCREDARGCEAVYLRDLQPYARANVRRGMISNAGLDGAREIIGRLRTNDLLPLCTSNGMGPSNGTGTVPAESPVTADPNASTPTTAGTPLPEKPSEPGVDCRTVR